MRQTKSCFPIMAIKAVLSAISIFSPRGREKNAPLTDMACWADCADLSKKRPVAVADPQTPTASLRFAFFPLYVSILEDLRSTKLRRFCVCVCVLWRCRCSSLCGRGALKRPIRHLPDCWNVNAMALIIGFCTSVRNVQQLLPSYCSAPAWTLNRACPCLYKHLHLNKDCS